MIVSCYQACPKHIFLPEEEVEKEFLFFLKKKSLWGRGWVVTFCLRFLLRTYLNFLQPLSWNNIDRRKWRESWPLQMELGILLGTLVVHRSKIHSYLVKPHHASTGGIKDPIYTAILSLFFPSDTVAVITKKFANHCIYYLQV